MLVSLPESTLAQLRDRRARKGFAWQELIEKYYQRLRDEQRASRIRRKHCQQTVIDVSVYRRSFLTAVQRSESKTCAGLASVRIASREVRVAAAGTT